MEMRGYTWRKHRVWEIVRFSRPVEGMQNGFRGAAFIGHYSRKDQTASRPSSKNLKMWSSKHTTANFSHFFAFDEKQEQTNLKLAKLQPNRIFHVLDKQRPCEEDKSVSCK